MAARTLLSIDIDRITESRTNPKGRTSGTAFDDLVASVREHGVLQPVLLRQKGNEKLYELIAGHRRLAAARIAQLEQIPANVVEMGDAEALELQLVENLQRADLHPLDEAEGYARLLKANYDVAKIAAKVGRSPAYVYDRMKLLALTKEAKRLFREDRFTPGHAVLLARLKPADQERALDLTNRAVFLEEERDLFREDGSVDRDADETDDMLWGYKACTVRELQGWIDTYVRFDPEAKDVPQLFPETAVAVKDADANEMKVVHITHANYVQPEARDGGRILAPRSWKDARKKSCPKVALGVIVVGPGRGTSLPVCVDKTCRVHWGAELREKAKNEKVHATGGAAAAKEQIDAQQKKRVEEEQARMQLRRRWMKGAAEMVRRWAAHVATLDAGPDSNIRAEVLANTKEFFGAPKDLLKLCPLDESPESVLRRYVYVTIAKDLFDDWQGPHHAKEIKKVFGFDAIAVLNEVAPEEKPAAEPPAKATRAKKRGAK